ncbi:MAG: STAS domain-containing protein [Spirochaetia bacterium]|nr:STAS domain-containing protein [Spirochaetia bacterium]MBR4437041.1 STAS domain-containing protein [Spirochaetales bacterium]MBR5017830.1 STAS domain-containing protein [Spirochaetia bacterium]MBR5914860.1 STAS domain-containing protein [Spirochaetia bacterium]MBR5927580.1 STAS domain-containing protein [Spirochaetia bacterium]
MEIKKNKEDAKLTLALSGRLDTLTAPQMEEVVRNEMEGVTALLIDLKDLTYVSSAGLRVLLMAQKTMNSRKGTMEICNVCDDIKEVFAITGFADIFTIK